MQEADREGIDKRGKGMQKRERKILFAKSILFTFLWGMIGHAYGLLNFTISHDSLEALYSGQTETHWKISLGRVFVPFYRLLIRGELTAPWLVGLLALIWIGISVYFVARIFRLDSDLLLVLTAGILTVNPVVCALAATYLHDFDVDMFALLLMVVAVYFWESGSKAAWAAIPCIAVGLGLYQSYLSVALVLMMMVLMLRLIEGEKIQTVLRFCLRACLLLLGGGVFYLLSVKTISAFWGQTITGSYNSISKLWLLSGQTVRWRILQTYYYALVVFLKPAGAYMTGILPFLNLCLGICGLGILVYALFRAQIPRAGRILLLVLCVLFPIALNLSFVLSDGVLHGLMMYAVCFIYLFLLLLVRWLLRRMPEKKSRAAGYFRICVTVATALVLWNSVVLSNDAYLKKDLERQQMSSLMTRAVAALEEREDYVQGETKLAFVGKIQKETMEGFEMFAGDGRTTGVIGLNENIQIKNARNYAPYFKYVLNIPANLCSESEIQNLAEKVEVKEMPVFPAHGSIKMLDGILIIKMGEV